LEKSEKRKSGKGNKIFWALALMAVGVLILLHNLGYIDHDIIRYWPVLIIIWGIKKLFD
jgi:hypothetical protein